jgi:phosphonate metabolism protein PhnN/1,5-bisphosphokinase (PRPP-forming)
MGGRVVLVVGPSGAGKDTLIAGAKAALAADRRFVFPRRVVTRTAIAMLEDHDSVSPEDFARQEASGAYALSWRAHGLCYGLPAGLIEDVTAGRIVVVNVSRGIIGAARTRYPDAAVIVVDAPVEVRARRLAARGRESEADIAERLAREGSTLPDGARRVDNSGRVETGVQQFVSTLQALAAG